MKKYHLMNHDDDVEYYIYEVDTEEGTQVQLFSSDSSKMWSDHARSELKLTATDTGNDIVFSKKIGKTLDYAELFELHIVLAFMRKDEMETFPYKLVEINTVFSI
jgi:hypothetical protein